MEGSARPQAVPDAPSEKPGPLQQALALIEGEAVAAMGLGHGVRGYARTEKLVAIARALRTEIGTRVDDFVGTPEPDATYTGNVRGNALMVDGDTMNISMPARGASADMRREQEMAQIEATEARRRRDDAAARVSMLEEFEKLQKIDVADLGDGVREGIAARMEEITVSLSKERPST
jgi:hypothetical protein